jgi:pimeloyl-[acyl-carrier protein] methyl ester esterase
MIHSLNHSAPEFRDGVDRKSPLQLQGVRASAYAFANGSRDVQRGLVCLAGMGANGRSFARQRPLADDHYVLPLNTPVDTPLDEQPLEYAVEVVAEYIAHEKLQKPVLLGSSFGGAVAALYALQHPGALKGLIFANAALSHRLIPFAFPGFVDLIQAPEPLAWMAAPIAVEIMGGLALDRDGRHEIVREARKFPGEELKRRLTALMRLDLLDDLPKLQLPTLWIHGSRDWLVSRSRAEKAAARIPNARFVVIQGAGHLPYLSHPAQFNAAVAEFLSALD